MKLGLNKRSIYHSDSCIRYHHQFRTLVFIIVNRLQHFRIRNHRYIFIIHMESYDLVNSSMN